MVEQTKKRELSNYTQESSKQFVRWLKQSPTNKRFPGYLCKRVWRRYWVCWWCIEVIVAIVADCDPYKREILLDHLRTEKPTLKLIRYLYKAISTDPKGLLDWLQKQGVSRGIRTEISRALPLTEKDVAEISFQHIAI